MSDPGRDAAGSTPAVSPTNGKLLPPGAGDTMRVLMEAATMKVDRDEATGSFSLVEMVTSPGGGVALHAHPASDEAIYVLEGSYDVRVGDQTSRLGPGGCGFAPRGTRHAFTNVGATPARLLVVASPGVDSNRVFVELAAGMAGAAAGGSLELAALFQKLAARRGVELFTDHAPDALPPSV